MDRYKEGYNDCDRNWRKKIEEKIKEIHNYTFMSNEEMRQQEYAIIKLEELLEENNEM